MKSNILIYTKDTFLFQDVVSAEFDVSVATSEEELFKLLNEHFFQLIIMSDKYILGGTTYGYKNLVDHPIYYDMPIIAYTKNNSMGLLTKLYSLNIKGCIDSAISKDDLLSVIHEVLNRSNPYIGRLRDRFIKVFIRYEDASEIVSKILYLTNYLIWYYKIDKEKAADIRISVVFLTIALRKNKLEKVTHLVHDMTISSYVDNIMINYKNPKSLDEQIVLVSLALENPNSKKDYKIDTSVLDEEVFSVAKEAMLKNKIYISCSHDIYSFWERLLQDFMQTTPRISVKYCDIYLHYIFKILYKALVSYGFVKVEFDTSNAEDYIIIVSPKECTDTTAQACVEELSSGCNENVKFDLAYIDSQPSFLIMLNRHPNHAKEYIKAETIVDVSKINSMHYKEEAKISAVDFLNDFEVDSEMLEDLLDNEREAKNFLYFKEDLTQEMIEAVSVALTRYTHLLHETIEFEDLAYSIGALTAVISNMILASLDEVKKSTLKLYITGIIDDLGSWREHIFLLGDTPDIHYLDASLLENCSEIEALINATNQELVESNEDDLEFF